MTLQWYRHYHRPWGYTIGYHDVTYPIVQGVTREVSKHFGEKGGFKFYSFVRKLADHQQKDPYVFRSNSWQKVVKALQADETRNQILLDLLRSNSVSTEDMPVSAGDSREG